MAESADSASSVREEALGIYERATGSGGPLRKGLQRDATLRRRLMKHGHTWSRFFDDLEASISGDQIHMSDFVQFYVKAYSDGEPEGETAEIADSVDSIEVWREIARGLKAIPPSERPTRKEPVNNAPLTLPGAHVASGAVPEDALVIPCPRRAIRWGRACMWW